MFAWFIGEQIPYSLLESEEADSRPLMGVEPVILRLEIFRMPLEMRPASLVGKGRREEGD
jgi:hypothetical protein